MGTKRQWDGMFENRKNASVTGVSCRLERKAVQREADVRSHGVLQAQETSVDPKCNGKHQSSF